MGVQTVEYLLTRMLRLCGYNAFATKEYMSRVRGGQNSTEIRISSVPVRAFVNRIDILVALNKGAVAHLANRVSAETMVLGEREILGDEAKQGGCRSVDVPFTKVANEIGNKIYSNIVAVGTVAALLRLDAELVTGCVRKYFASKAGDVVAKNVEAVQAGYKLGTEIAKSAGIDISIKPDTKVKDQMLLSGTEAVGMGAIAAGCNFVASYPMSPSTGVLVFLARHGRDFGIIAEQAEDEIAAVNMAVGAWYAGARALATTSGGGFALMTEGVSLAGMLETPVVIHLAQRPGPATGLPTRTEQGDLELALYAGHGEFPRVLLCPGTIDEAFHLTAKAFNLADKYQVPVFVLTDQYLLDSYYNTPAFDLSKVNLEKHFVKTKADYRRYEITDSGVSPRGIPGFGDGLVCVDSDEHDTQGHITEDMAVRTQMVDKRLKKLELLKKEAVPPELWPNTDYKNLIVCWGSTYPIVKEALQRLQRDDTSLLHFSQVYPLHNSAADYLQKAQKTILLEGNATGQFGKLIKMHTGIDIDERILKYGGISFAVEEVLENLKRLLD